MIALYGNFNSSGRAAKRAGLPAGGVSLRAAAIALLVYCGCLHAFVLLPAASSTVQHEIGITHQYDYVALVRMTERRPAASDVTYEITGPVDVTSVWQNPSNAQEYILLIEFNPRIRVTPKGTSSMEDHASALDSKTHHPVALAIDNGRIVGFFADSSEEEDELNLKRGVASLFQMQDQYSQIEEVDASGKCNVTYKISGKKVKKFKDDCDFHKRREHYAQPNKVVGVDISSESESTYEIQHDVIHFVESREFYYMTLRSLQGGSITVEAKQKISFTGQKASTISVNGNDVSSAIKSLTKDIKKNLISTDITLTETSKTCTTNCKSLKELVKEWKDSLLPKNLAKVKAASAFLRLVHQCRKSNKNEILDAIKATNNKKTLAALLDAVVAAQTTASYEAIFETLPTLKDPDVVERTLLALAVAPRPTPEAVKRMTKIVEQNNLDPDKVRPTAALALGSMLKNLCHRSEKCEEKIAKDAIDLLVNRLNQCKDDSCHVTYLRSLRNAARPSTLHALLPFVEKGGKKSRWSLEAIRALPSDALTQELRPLLLHVFHQTSRKYETTARLLAADILLNFDVTEDTLKELVQGLETFDETSTYLSARIKEFANKNPKLRSILTKLKSDPTVLGNYNHLAQPGISTAFTNLLANTNGGNSTYGLHLELAKGGLLRQSSFDVHVNNDEDQIHILGFGIYASGLGNLVSSSDDSDAADEGDPTAGMELVVLDVALRPYVFFVGRSEIMSHVWSGTASEPTPIIQGNFLLHDSKQQMALQCGFVLLFRTTGALSADVSGSLQASLWNQNAHNEVSAKGALLVQGMSSIDSSFVRSSVAVAINSEASLNFVTDSEFAETPFKMCTQMNQPPFNYRFNVRKTESIPNTKHKIRKIRKVKSKIAGKSFDLHPKNSALCHIMMLNR